MMPMVNARYLRWKILSFLSLFLLHLLGLVVVSTILVVATICLKKRHSLSITVLLNSMSLSLIKTVAMTIIFMTTIYVNTCKTTNFTNFLAA